MASYFMKKRKLKFLREDKIDSAMTLPYLCVLRVCGKNFRYLTLLILIISSLLCFPSGPRSTVVCLGNLNEKQNYSK